MAKSFIVPVTEERYQSKDYYRMLVDIDKDLMAFGYNALVGCYGRERAERIRNELKAQLAGALERRLAELLTDEDGTFERYLKVEYLPKMVKSDKLRGKAKRLYRRLKEIGDGLKP